METVTSRRRSRQVEELALGLPQRVSALTRLFFARARVSRSEVGLLAALAVRPYRITELSAREGVTQPAVTQLVNRLQDRGWVERRTDPADGRAVLVELTEAGRVELEGVRAEYRALLREEMAALDDEEVATLAAAVEILDRLVARLGERTA
jgi:DNA-binding MarR family transcriptional regulator